MTKRSTPTGAGKSASLAEARNNGVTAMTEVTQDELAKELGFLPATARMEVDGAAVWAAANTESA
jgi:hypothetical protein